MTQYPVLEINLRRQAVGVYEVEVRFNHPASAAEDRLGQTQPALAHLDSQALRALEYDPAAYGAALTAGLFAEPALRAALALARAKAQKTPLRLRLSFGVNAPELHGLRWETLRNPQDDTLLCTNENLLFSRYLSSPDWREVSLLPPGDWRALTVIASPVNLPDYQLSPLDIFGEAQRAKAGLGEIPQTLLPDLLTGRRATCANLLAALRESNPALLYLVCHGALVKDEPWLWLENDEGQVERLAGSELAAQLKELRQLPTLAVLLSCQSAGVGTGAALTALGPRLVEAGLPAVLAMQGNFTMASAAQFLPVFFKELRQDGQLDRALAVARGAIRARSDAWMPVLFTRLKDGNLFTSPPPTPTAGKTYTAQVVGNKNTIVQGDGNTIVGAGGMVVKGQVGGDVVGPNARVEKHYHQTPPSPPPLPPAEALTCYLEYLIETHRCLRLQGIRAGSQPLSVELEKVYISLTAQDKQAAPPDEKHAARRPAAEMEEGAGGLTIPAALRRYRRLVIIGNPGCGKTTLLAYLALTYARARRGDALAVQTRLQLAEADHLPILLPLRAFGQHLKNKHADPSCDGAALLLAYLREYYAGQTIELPLDFFAAPLEAGRAVILLDGLDEVAETQLRQRVARLIEQFAARYPKNRFVITSREVGYTGPARIGAEFGLAKVRDFSPAEVRQFVRDWTRVVEITLAGHESPDLVRQAAEQAERLIKAIEATQCVAELAVNPLLLTVIALVHRYRARLPDRRSELYEEAVEVLLGQWDEAKGLEKTAVVAGRELDAGDRRSLLEPVAFWLHERQRWEIELDELRQLLQPSFATLVGGEQRQAEKALAAFLQIINERSGLLIDRGGGVYGFAHQTFQEYLAARALADRAEAVPYTLARLGDPWWREVILLAAGYLSTQGKRRVSELIRAIMEAPSEASRSDPHQHLFLAAECLFDIGPARVEGDLLGEVKRRLQVEADKPLKKERGDKAAVLNKVVAMNALARIVSGKMVSRYWKAPWGEPEWVPVPAGEFWMGSEKGFPEEKPVHRVFVAEFQIARVPITNAQYALFVGAVNVEPPEDWRGKQPPVGKENHPVVNVSWHAALKYCVWLSAKIDQEVRLPSAAEWEKAARGGVGVDGHPPNQREYPWGDGWKELLCNSRELRLGETSPVGLFLNGASLYGLLDMSGNVWEWTRSLWGSNFRAPEYKYPYVPDDERENLQAPDNVLRCVRGGSFYVDDQFARCACRFRFGPSDGYGHLGFRVVVSPPSAPEA